MKRLKNLDWTKVIIYLTFAILVGAISTLLYWGFRPYEVYENVEQPYRVLNDNKQVQAGTPVFVEQVYCKRGNYPARVSIVLEDGYYEVIKTIETRVEGGCYSSVSKSALIPFYTSPNTYRIKYKIEVRVNPIRSVSYELYSENFEVIPNSIIIEE